MIKRQTLAIILIILFAFNFTLWGSSIIVPDRIKIPQEEHLPRRYRPGNTNTKERRKAYVFQKKIQRSSL